MKPSPSAGPSVAAMMARQATAAEARLIRPLPSDGDGIFRFGGCPWDGPEPGPA